MKNTSAAGAQSKKPTFTPYEKFVIALLAVLQFTIVLDFMVLSPLSAILLDELDITTAQFGLVVSAYAFSAGAAGILAAGFADRFDRKKFLLFFYAGFILGTLLCGLAPTYEFLLGARIVTGLFGGVMSAISYAIITDLFPLDKRGRVMGFVQMAFAASQVLGIPLSLYLATHLDWHGPFMLIVAVSILVFIAVAIRLKPIDAHLKIQEGKNAFHHLLKTASNRNYLKGFSVTIFLATGGFMLMPFASAFVVNNLGIALTKLPIIYLVTGLFTMVAGPLIGKLSDRVGKYKIFWIGSSVSMILVVIFTNLGITPLWQVILINIIMFAALTGRMISAQALLTAVPAPPDRGAFMGINSSVQQISGGIASAISGWIVLQSQTGQILHYDIAGYVVCVTTLCSIALMYFINKMVMR